MARRVIDDVFDVLEADFAELIRIKRDAAHDSFAALMRKRRTYMARVAAGMLAGLIRQGFAWRPSEHGYEAAEWRAVLLSTAEELGYDERTLALLRRELDELTALAGPGGGPRREGPAAGTFQAFAFAAGVHPAWVRHWGRYGRDHLAGWDDCDGADALVRLARAAGASTEDLVRSTCTCVLALAPEGEVYRAAALAGAYRGLAGLREQGEALDELRRSCQRDPPERFLATVVTNLVSRAQREPFPASVLESCAKDLLLVTDAAVLRRHLGTSAVRSALAGLGAEAA